MDNTWPHFFINLAHYIARRSKDPSTKAGAVLTTANNRIISMGYNGLPHGVADTPQRYLDRSVKYSTILHAETNAILFAKRDLTGTTMYLTTHPCAHCTSLMIQAGISLAIYDMPTLDFLKRWHDDITISQQLANEAGLRLLSITNLEPPTCLSSS